jgi:hypothetical protein
MIREVHGFPTPSKSESSSSSSASAGGKEGKVFIGVMGCSPLGKGTEANFERLEWIEGVRDLV